jgi:hypothetical protein
VTRVAKGNKEVIVIRTGHHLGVPAGMSVLLSYTEGSGNGC